MAGLDFMRIARRNKLVGVWAAEKLALVGEDATTYSDELAKAAFDINRSDILPKIRSDFEAALVVQSDEEIVAVMSKCWLEAGKKSEQSSNASDTAVVQIARNLMR